MAQDMTTRPMRVLSLDRSIERLRQQLTRIGSFLSSGTDFNEQAIDEFDSETEAVLREALGGTSELLEAYEYAQLGEAAGLVNFPDEAPEGGTGARDLTRESLNQRKRVIESCIAELEARRAALAESKILMTQMVIGPRVADHMSGELRSIDLMASLKQAGRLMQEQKVGSILVSDDHGYVGVITDTDLAREVVARGLDPVNTPVKICMRRPPVTIDADEPIIEAVRLMKDNATRHLAVTEGGTVVGVISVSNILRYYSGVV